MISALHNAYDLMMFGLVAGAVVIALVLLGLIAAGRNDTEE